MKKIFSILSFLSFFFLSYAQTDIGLNFANTVFQSNVMNPAYSPRSKVVVALPSAAVGYYNSLGGLKVNNGQTQFSSSAESGQILINGEATVFGIGFAVGENGFLSIGQKVSSEFGIGGKTNLFKTLVGGNAQFIGQEIEVTPQLNAMIFGEWNVTYAHQWNKWNFGVKMKSLNGWAALETDDASKISLTTKNDFYQLQFDANYTLNASSAIAAPFGNLDTVPSSFFNGITKTSRGFGLDLGATYALSDKITLGASLINGLGSIKWKNASAYNAKSRFELDGIDVVKLATDSTFGIKFANLDTLVDKLSFQKTPTTFRTKSTRYLNLSASYQVNNILTANALLGFSSRGSYLALNGTLRFKNWIETGLTYSIRNRSAADLGANVALKLGWLQIYAVADNFLAIARPLQANNFNARVGVNLAFGKRTKTGQEVPNN
jgi:hypothetical protein